MNAELGDEPHGDERAGEIGQQPAGVANHLQHGDFVVTGFETGLVERQPGVAQRVVHVDLHLAVLAGGGVLDAHAAAEILGDVRAGIFVVAEFDEVERIVITPKAVDDQGFTVSAEGEGYRVRGRRVERWVRQTDFSNDEAVGYLSDRLARAGIEVELAKAGAVAGSEVVIGPGDNAVVFDWQPTTADLHQGPRGTDERLHENTRPGAAERLAAHRIRQWGVGGDESADINEVDDDDA